MTGIIIKAISSFYYVDSKNIIYECKARGNFRKNGISPVVGDTVSITVSDENHGVIEEIHERKNYLSRPVIANLQKLIIVSSYNCPAPNTLLIDRLISAAEYNKIEPIIVFNKCDTGDFSYWLNIYKNAGFKTFLVSATENIGIEALKKEISSSFCAFAGNSGVGKSSIINKIFGDFALKTGEVSEKLGRGRHTTRHTELFKNGKGGFIADTPGFATVDSAVMPKDELAYNFRDFSEYLGKCKFSTCSHTCEKGCAVLSALNDGLVSRERHENYCTIYRELSSLNDWEL